MQPGWFLVTGSFSPEFPCAEVQPSLLAPKVIQGLKSRILFKGSIKANTLLKINWHPICCQAGNLVSTARGRDERLQ